MIVQLPDGRVVDFGDLPQAEVEKALQQLSPSPSPGLGDGSSATSAPPQQTGWLRYPEMAGEAAIQGLTRLLGTPGDILATTGLHPLPASQAIGPATETAGFGGGGLGFPTSQDLANTLVKTGIPALPSSTLIPGKGPFPEAERLGTAAISGIASNLPYLAAGPEGLAAKLAITGGGGLAGELAHQYAPDVPFGSAAAGALVGGGVQGVRNLLAGNPVERVARELGTSATQQDAGTALQEWGKSFRDPGNPSGMSALIGAEKAKLDSQIPPGTDVPPSQLVSNAQELLTQGGAKANAVRNFFSRTAKSGGTRGASAGLVQGNLVSSLSPRWGIGPAPLGWNASSALRSELGAAYRSSRDPEEHAALKYLYAGHTQDLGQAAAGAGLGDQFQAYNKLSTDLHDLDEGPVQTIMNSEPGTAANTLIARAKRQGTELQALRQAGAPVDELGAAALRLGAWKNLSPEAKFEIVQDPKTVGILDAAASKRAPGKLASGLHTLTGFTGGELAGHALSHLFGIDPTTLGGLSGLAVGGLSQAIPAIGRTVLAPNMLGAGLVGAQAGRQEPKR